MFHGAIDDVVGRVTLMGVVADTLLRKGISVGNESYTMIGTFFFLQALLKITVFLLSILLEQM
jgi:hypothetical protein